MTTIMPSTDFDSSLSETSAAVSKKAWLVCFVASLFFFYEFMQVNIFNAIDPFLLKEFQVSATRLGQLSAHYFYANVIFLFPAGIILDRFSTKKIIVLSMGLCVLGTFAFAYSPNIDFADACRFATGIGGAFTLLSNVRLASRWFPPKRMALVIGLIVTVGMIGGMVAQTPMTLVTDYFGWRNALRIDGVLGLVIIVLIFFVVQDYPTGRESFFKAQLKNLHAIGFWKANFSAIKNLQNWLAGLYTSLVNLPIFLIGAMWGGLYLVQTQGFTRTQASYITSMIFVGTIIGSPVFGWLSDRIGRRKLPMIVCAVFAFIVMLIYMYSPHLTLFSAMLLIFLLGFFTAAQIISYPLIAESNTLMLTGAAEGLASVIIMAGGLTQPLYGFLMGLHWDHTIVDGIPVYSLANYHAAMLVMPIAIALGLILILFAKETYCKAKD